MVTFVVGVVGAMFGAPLAVLLPVMGAVLALTTWWGPGASGCDSARRVTAALNRDPWVGWAAVAAVAIVLVPLLAYGAGEISWRPAPGAPWREGTLLNRLLGFV